MTITRPYFTRQRRQLSTQQKRQHARHASGHLRKLHRRLPKHAKIGIYYDGFAELPTQPIIDWCRRLGYQVYLPVVGTLSNTDKRLRFSPMHHTQLKALRTYNHLLGMKQHRHNIKLWAHQLDIIFCPLVAVDNTGTRLGMGGGYYDRTLAYSYQQRLQRPLILGWCYDFQYVPTDSKIQGLPRKTWDVPLNGVIMPRGIMWFDKSIKVVQSVNTNVHSSADAVDEYLKKLSAIGTGGKANRQPVPIAERVLTDIVNDKRLTELLNNCDDFLQIYGNIQDEFE